MTTFEPGNIVQIKSGGPIMTVVSVDDNNVHCLWYGESSDAIRTAALPHITLDLLEVVRERKIPGGFLSIPHPYQRFSAQAAVSATYPSAAIWT